MTTPYAPAGDEPVLRIGARTSPLARAQVELVAGLLAEHGVRTRFVGVTTTGDVDRRHLTEIGGTGVFATAVRDALHERRIDLAVHSLKDLPTAAEPDLHIVAVPQREDTRDVLVGLRLDDLRDGVRVGTGAPRRALQLLDWAERNGRHVEVVPIRGNVDTRIELARTGNVDAVLLAYAGLSRLGHLDLSDSDNSDIVVKGLASQVLPESLMLPAPGQGALGLEIHSSLSPTLRAFVQALDNPVARAEALVERGFLATLEAGCTAPVGARAIVKSVRGTTLDLTLTAVIGKTLLSNLSEPYTSGPPVRLEVHGSTTDPAHFGATHAREVLATLPD